MFTRIYNWFISCNFVILGHQPWRLPLVVVISVSRSEKIRAQYCMFQRIVHMRGVYKISQWVILHLWSKIICTYILWHNVDKQQPEDDLWWSLLGLYLGRDTRSGRPDHVLFLTKAKNLRPWCCRKYILNRIPATVTHTYTQGMRLYGCICSRVFWWPRTIHVIA